jgi:uncharacterized protein (TIGR00730 family)
MTIAVYCSASNDLDSSFYEVAEGLGKFIGAKGHTLVYGGSARGIMERLAKTVSNNGGDVIGIIPENIKEHASDYVSELMVTDTVDERKAMIKEYADAFVVLAGGFGTLDEFFNVLADKQLGYVEMDKPLIIVNTNNYYDPLVKLIENIKLNKFVGEVNKKAYTIVNTMEECTALLENL